jgi:hypothetical protein
MTITESDVFYKGFFRDGYGAQCSIQKMYRDVEFKQGLFIKKDCYFVTFQLFLTLFNLRRASIKKPRLC